jgi:hypothetical protein
LAADVIEREIGAEVRTRFPRGCGWLSAVVAVLPVRALAQILEQGYTPVEHASLADPFVLLAWTAAGCAFAAWRFRWH